MSMYILDTDHVSLYQQAHPQIVGRVAQQNPNAIAVTVVTVEEQMRGWLSAIRKAEQSRLIWAYTGLQKTTEFYRHVQLLAFGEAALEHYNELRKLRLRVGTQDLRIAAIALSANGTVITRNRRDFAQITGLQIADWTQ